MFWGEKVLGACVRKTLGRDARPKHDSASLQYFLAKYKGKYGQGPNLRSTILNVLKGWQNSP